MIIRLSLRNRAETFWNKVDHLFCYEMYVPDEIVSFILPEAGAKMEVSDERGREIEEWCQQVDGFEDGPDDARTALEFILEEMEA